MDDAITAVNWLRQAADEIHSATDYGEAEAAEDGLDRAAYVEDAWLFFLSNTGSDFEPTPGWWEAGDVEQYKSIWVRRFTELLDS